MKKITMILLVAFLLAGCDALIPEITVVGIESDGTFDFVLYSDGARVDSGNSLKAYYTVAFYDVAIRIMPIDDSNCALYLDGVETAFTANVINEF